MGDAILEIPEAILASCETSNHGKTVTEWLIQWKHQLTRGGLGRKRAVLECSFPTSTLRTRQFLRMLALMGHPSSSLKSYKYSLIGLKVDGGKNSFE